MSRKEDRGPLIGLGIIVLIALGLAVWNGAGNLRDGGRNGADGIWHSVGGLPR